VSTNATRPHQPNNDHLGDFNDSLALIIKASTGFDLALLPTKISAANIGRPMIITHIR
jgi:hypothetical protein